VIPSRITSSPLEPRHEDKEYVSNVSRQELEGLAEELEQGTLGNDPIVLFGTGYGVKTLFDESTGDDEGSIYESPPKAIDMLLLDEASMCTLPTFMMSGAFIKPEAQVFISGDHRQMPPVQSLVQNKTRICLGTDSLASNSDLSILEEMKTIARHFPRYSLHRLLKWATLNGANALGFDDYLGTLAKGKTPGLNLIKNLDTEELALSPDSEVEMLVPAR
jgi:hypothetical protein